MKHRASAAERAHMGRVSAMECICCYLMDRKQETPTEVHHCRTMQGGAQRGGSFLTMPLCGHDCHRGKNGVHGDKTYLRILQMTELDLLNATIERLYGVTK